MFSYTVKAFENAVNFGLSNGVNVRYMFETLNAAKIISNFSSCSNCKRTFENKASFVVHEMNCPYAVALCKNEPKVEITTVKVENTGEGECRSPAPPFDWGTTATLDWGNDSEDEPIIPEVKIKEEFKVKEEPRDSTFDDDFAWQGADEIPEPEREDVKPKSKPRPRQEHLCSICARKYTQIRFLRRHVLEQHSGQRLSCDLCGYETNSKAGLYKHMKRLHLAKAHTCETCGKSFGLLASFVNHKQTHMTDRAFKCQSCPKSFSWESVLQIHIKEVHSNTAIICKICGKFFKRYGTWYGHMRRKHPGEETLNWQTKRSDRFLT